MNEQFFLYRKFSTFDRAQYIKLLFENNGIETRIGDNVAPVDVTFSTGRNATDQIEIRIKTDDFIKADMLLGQEAEKDFNSLDPNYYLYAFTNEELYDILLKSDEWNIFDYRLAQKILIERGKPIDEELLTILKKQRLKDLSKPENNQKMWIASGYIMALLGGFFGIVIGYMLWTQKKTLPNGTKVYSFKKSDRVHGQQITILSILTFIFYIVLKFVIIL